MTATAVGHGQLDIRERKFVRLLPANPRPF